MEPGDTITALATGWSMSDRALVRLSGPQVPLLLQRCFSPGVTLPESPASVAGRFRLRASESAPTPSGFLPLPALVLLYPAPRSYTGEDSAEILLPGNPALIERVLATLLGHNGVREASPGEFTARAYLAGKMTLAQAEGVAATIASSNEDDLAAARSVLDGSTGMLLRGWCDQLATLLALVEAGIDFADQEDVVPISRGSLAVQLTSLAAAIRDFLCSVQGAEARSDIPVVVLAGAPNAGKSTLYNALLGRPRAVVSPIAGTTRDIIVEELDLSREVPGGPMVRVTDLAGLDESLVEDGSMSVASRIDRDAQERARRAIDEADAVVYCDPTGRFGDAFLQKRQSPMIRVRTKADLPQSSTAGGGEGAAGIGAALSVCALDGWNLGPLRRAIADSVLHDRTSGGIGVLPRYHRSLTRAAVAIDEALARLGATETLAGQGVRRGEPIGSPELVAGSLRAALDELGSLVGRMSPDDVIGRIFSTFCIGK